MGSSFDALLATFQFGRAMVNSRRLRRALSTLEKAGFASRIGLRSATRHLCGICVEATLRFDADGHVLGLTLGLDVPALVTDLSLSAARPLLDLVTSDHQVGEARFDPLVRVSGGDPLRVQALLDAASRDAVLAVIRDGGRLEEGQWRAWFANNNLPDAETLDRLSASLVDAHLQLFAGLALDPTEALAAQARSDRAPGVRHRALTLLCDRGIASAALLQSVQDDLDPQMRLTAARAGGSSSRNMLLSLLQTGSRSWRVQAAIDLAGMPLSGGEHAEVQQQLITALSDPEWAAQAATALGPMGNAEAVAPLAHAERSGPARREARESLAAVRARMDPEQAGRLTLVHPSGGELSTVDPADAFDAG